jgi:hypothetical protein
MDSRRSIEGKRCCNRSIPRPRMAQVISQVFGFCLEEIEVLNGFDVNGISMISTMISTSNAWEFNDL